MLMRLMRYTPLDKRVFGVRGCTVSGRSRAELNVIRRSDRGFSGALESGSG